MGRTDPTDLAACLAVAQRRVGDASEWSSADWEAQLAEDSVERGDPPTTHYRPYRSAIAYLTRPGQVKARTEGDVSEQYVDPATTLSELQRLDTEWEAEVLPPKAAASTDEWDGGITWGGW